MRTWCGYLFYSEQYGTCLAYGWAVKRDGINVLVEPEDGSEPVWKQEDYVDLKPYRREGESMTAYMGRTRS